MSGPKSGVSVICFGEVLWDLLPRGRFIGGALLNVTYHLTRLGCAPILASAVGPDQLGTDTFETLKAAGVDTRGIQRHATLLTGIAEVKLDAAGQPTFHLPQPRAWDDIDVGLLLHGPSPAAVVFGTLALRSQTNRRALERLLSAFPETTVVCDLNLRPPFDDIAPLGAFIDRAHLLKLNADEARRLCGRPAAADDWSAMAAELQQRYRGALICITLGGEGAGICADGHWYQATAQKVTVRDTVGAGDAFTAALLAGWLRNREEPDWPRLLRAACALGAYVASRDGAQPDYEDFKMEW